jgi:hypothetical protein
MVEDLKFRVQSLKLMEIIVSADAIEMGKLPGVRAGELICSTINPKTEA